MKRGRPKHDDILTRREWEVLALIREGLTNDAIAERLAISSNTAKFHVSEILTKLGVSTREEAAAWRRPTVPARLGLSLPLILWLRTGMSVARGLAGVAAIALGITVLVLVLSDRSDAAKYDAGPLGKIAFVQDGDIWMKALPDGTPQRLTRDANAGSPRWSSTGEWLLYFDSEVTVDDTGPSRPVWVIRADGSDARQLDGRGLYAFWMPGTDEVFYSPDDDSIAIESADGKSRRDPSRLPLPTSGAGAGEEGEIAGLFPSPDGQWFVYIDQRWPAGMRSPLSSPTRWTYQGVWIIRNDGTGAREVFDLGPSPSGRLFVTGWTADSRNLLYAVPANQFEGDSFYDGWPLGVASVDTGVTHDLGLALSPFAQSLARSDGTTILVAGFVRETWTDKRIVSLDADLKTTTLTTPDVAALAPSWSPDGTRIAYAASPDLGVSSRDAALRSRRIWLMAADGSGKRQLTTGEGFRDDAPSWSSDGTHLLFARLPVEPAAARMTSGSWRYQAARWSLSKRACHSSTPRTTDPSQERSRNVPAAPPGPLTTTAASISPRCSIGGSRALLADDTRRVGAIRLCDSICARGP